MFESYFIILTSITIEYCTWLVSYSQLLHFSSGQLSLTNCAKFPEWFPKGAKTSVQLIAYRMHPFFTWVTLLCNQMIVFQENNFICRKLILYRYFDWHHGYNIIYFLRTCIIPSSIATDSSLLFSSCIQLV